MSPLIPGNVLAKMCCNNSVYVSITGVLGVLCDACCGGREVNHFCLLRVVTSGPLMPRPNTKAGIQ